MSKTSDALEDLVPFAEAILALKEAQTDLDRIKSNVDGHKTVLIETQKSLDRAQANLLKTNADASSAREAELVAKRGIEEANAERERILAKAKADAQAAYDAQLTIKNESFGALDRKIAQARTTLSETEKSIEDAKTRLAEIESQIGTLKNRFG